MARGDITLYEVLALQLGQDVFDFTNDTYKLAFVTSATTPVATEAAPNLSLYTEVSAAGGYTTGGITLTATGGTIQWSEVDGVGTFDADNIALALDAGGFTDARWGIIIESVSDSAVGFVDYGSDLDETAGAIEVNWNASGVFTINV